MLEMRLGVNRVSARQYDSASAVFQLEIRLGASAVDPAAGAAAATRFKRKKATPPPKT